MKILEVFNKEYVGRKDKYNFIVEEVWYGNSRRRAKYYIIEKNNKIILHTTLYQTWYKYERQLKQIGTILI